MPATRCRIEPYNGTAIRYPPPNIANGPQSPTSNAGESFIITFERHVYQAGSRVAALIDGSWRNAQPKPTSTARIATTSTAGWRRRSRDDPLVGRRLQGSFRVGPRHGLPTPSVT